MFAKSLGNSQLPIIKVASFSKRPDSVRVKSSVSKNNIYWLKSNDFSQIRAENQSGDLNKFLKFDRKSTVLGPDRGQMSTN